MLFKKPVFAICFLLLAFTSPMDAQFAKLKDKVKAKKSKVSTKTSKVDPAFGKFIPAISMHSLLKQNGLKLKYDGTFSSPGLEVAFLPTKDKKGNEINYNPMSNSEAPILTADIMKVGSKKSLGTFHYTVSPVMKPFSIMNHKIHRDYTSEVKLAEGDYEMIFKLAGSHYYTYPFTIIKKTDNDPYAAVEEAYFMHGAWQEWNYLSFGSGGNVNWTHFEPNETMGIENEFRVTKRKPFGIQYALYRNDKKIAANDSRMTSSKENGLKEKIDYKEEEASRTEYLEVTKHLMALPGKDPRSWNTLKKEDLTDGKYRMEVRIKDCEGKERTNNFHFNISAGKIQRHENTDHKQHKDPKTIVEGGRDLYFFKKS